MRLTSRRDGRGALRAEAYEAVLALAGLCLFGGIILYPQLARMDAVPDLGDPLFSIWRMGWVYRQLLGDPRGLFDANIFHPERLTFTFSDAMLLPSVAAAPLHALRFHPVVVYNTLLVAMFILSGWTAYLLVRRLTGSPPAAFVSGLIFGFYPYRFEHYSHLELQMTALMPLALLALHRFTADYRWRWLGIATILAVGQLYSSMYYGLFFVLFASVVGAVWIATGPAPPRRLLLQLAGAAALYAALAAPLASPYLRSAEVGRGRDSAEVARYSATPMDFLRAHRGSATWAAITPPGRQEERQLFPGLTAIALAIVGLAPPFRRSRLPFVAGTILAFDVSLGVNGLTYPLLYEWLPPVRAMRAPARFSILFGLGLAVLAGFGVSRLLEGRPRRWTSAVMSLAIAAVAIDVWPVLRLTPVWRTPPPIYATLAGRPGVVLAEFPAGGVPERFDATPYMYFSLWHWQPMINGYSGYHPRSYVENLELLERFPDPAVMALLRSRGVSHVTVNCALFSMAGYEERCGHVLSASAGSPALREVARARWEGAPVVLFELVHQAIGAERPADALAR